MQFYSMKLAVFSRTHFPEHGSGRVQGGAVRRQAGQVVLVLQTMYRYVVLTLRVLLNQRQYEMIPQHN